MDRRFLLQPEVVESAKKFVCIRLTSYEDESEKAFVSKFHRGEVSNTAFALLTPEGTLALRGRGPGRGPMDLFQDSAGMAKGMDSLAANYTPKKSEGVPALPVTLTPKIGMVVAASDNLPLILVVASDPKKIAELEAKVAVQAWSKEFAGRCTYATAAGAKDIPKLKGKTIIEGVMLIEPDIFGAAGDVVGEVPGNQISGKLSEAMETTLRKHVPVAKSRGEMARKGYDQDIFYETNIDVSGRGEAADRERYHQLLLQKKKK